MYCEYTHPIHVNKPTRRPKRFRSNGMHKHYQRVDNLTNRLVCTADIRATEHHWIIDTYITSHGSTGCKTNRRSQSQCLKYTGTNNQSQNSSLPSLPSLASLPSICPTLNVPESPARFVHLPEIHHNLYISDRAGIDEWVQFTRRKKPIIVPIVITLFDGPVRNVACTVKNIPTQDSRNMTFHDFYQPYQCVRTILDAHACPILIACQSGVNRSSMMAVAYGIQTTELAADQLMEYIMREKFKISPFWDTLTNTRMRAILRQLQSRRPKGSKK